MERISTHHRSEALSYFDGCSSLTMSLDVVVRSSATTL